MSKSIGNIFGTQSHSNKYVNKNLGEIQPFTRMDGSIGYHLHDKRPEKIRLKITGHTFDDNLKHLYLKKLDKSRFDAGNKDLERKIWERNNQQCLRPYDNYMEGEERIEHLRNGQNLFLDIENNPNAEYEMPWYSNVLYVGDITGNYYLNKYGDIIEKYAQQYNVDPDLVKSIMYNEAFTGHKYGGNYIGDVLGYSESQMPMNIRGKTWGNFDGRQYNTANPEQNIELAVQVIKRLQNSTHNPTIEKIGTLYNATGAMEVNNYGARTKTIYDEKPWLKRNNIYRKINIP